MIEFRTLGSLELRGRDGEDLVFALSQPKRLALLAYLAIATPRGSHRRETLLALLWPELDARHAGHALSQALYFLGQQLGQGVVRRRGSGDVGLDWERFRCDVKGFEEALERGDLAAALERYRGDVLPGLHVSEAPEFERWLDGERASLRGRASAAAHTLTDRCESAGDLAAAAHWAERATTLDPFDEGAVQRLIRILDRAGDRCAAVRVYEDFGERLRQELELEPAPETRALIAAARERTALVPAAPRRAAEGPAAPSVPEPPMPARRRQRPPWRSTLIAASLAGVLGASLLDGLPASGDGLWASGAEHRVAVLPFENIGGAAEQDYFADGLTEEIILELSRLRSLKPISRASTVRFKGAPRDLREIGRDLGVKAVLEGSVRLGGSHVRITARLSDTRTNEHLWSELYERELTDIFDIQADIAVQIARSLDAQLSPGEREAMERRPTHDPAAYREYLKGRHLTWGPEPVRAIEYLERAITLDPEYARAHAGLADVYGQLGVLGSMPPRQAFERAKAAAERALALDPVLPEAHTALGAVHFWFAWDWQKARAAYRRAFQLGRPGHLDHYVAYLMAMGQTTEAIREAERRLELDPLGQSRNLALAWTYFMVGRHDAAIAQLHRTLELYPGFAWAQVELAWNYAFAGRHREAVAEARRAEELLGGPVSTPGGTDFALASLAHVYATAGMRDEATRILRNLSATSRQRYVDPFKFAVVHAGLGDVEEAFHWLGRAFAARSPQLVYLTPMSRHFFAGLRSDPRYRALLDRMRLPQSTDARRL